MKPDATRLGRWTGWLATVALTAASALLLSHATAADKRAEDGRRLYSGQSSDEAPPLRGRLAGNPMDLPASATRCINCHAAATFPGASAPSLQGGALQRSTPRRGGPPSAYDKASLCRLLRDGIDPAFVVVEQTMPRFDATDEQCAALWSWLNRTNEG